VARAAGHRHVAGATGRTSELAAMERFGLPVTALLDMGDFAGALLAYLRRHPVPRLTIAGGIGKLSKLADGHLDLHSARSQVDPARLAATAEERGADPGLVAQVRTATTALHALELCQAAGVSLADGVAEQARQVAQRALGAAPVVVDVLVVDREGQVVGEATAH
jgi:cobalt-precorrin-5B (C1)-methyltransferase